MPRSPRNSDPAPSDTQSVPNAKIAELYGRSPEAYTDQQLGQSLVRKCPIRRSDCDVTANRHHTAYIDLHANGVRSEERERIIARYGQERLPLGICSCWTKRQNEQVASPWILCPKRLLALEPPKPVIPTEVRQLILIPDGTRVGVWRELKFRQNEQPERGATESARQQPRFFEYTFDFLMMALDAEGRPSGPPYIVEVMTSSTRGGGLTEHMVDVLLGRPQRYLGGGVVKSVYTPNYRQVFERMLGQFVVKSEIAERWGGRTIWVFQDVLLDYIEQTTAFESGQLDRREDGNVFAEVYRLEPPELGRAGAASGLRLVHHKSLRGRARLSEHARDYTSLVGLGYAPPLSALQATLRTRQSRALRDRERELRTASTMDEASYFEFTWGEEIDPRWGEPTSRRA